MRMLLIIIVMFSTCFANTIFISSYNHKSKYVKFTHTIVNDVIDELSELLELNDVNIEILLFKNQTDFFNITGLPEHIPGALITTKNIIYLKTPDVTKMDKSQYQNLLCHEMLHSIQNQKVSLTIFPDWFNEGFAEYFSGSYSLSQKIKLSRIMLSKQFPDLYQMENINHKYNHTAVDKYILSASAIEFLYINFGSEFFIKFFDDMVKTKDFNQSLYNSTNLTFEQLNFYWKKFLDKKYNKLFLIDLQYIIWLFLPFLFIFSFIVKQILNQTIINRWKYEKLEEQINNIFNNQFFANEHTTHRTSSLSSK